MCVPFENVEPRTQEGIKCVGYLEFLAASEVVVALLKMFVFRDIVGGFYELLSCLILWMAWAQLSYCLCLLYIVYICILGAITYTVSILTPLQNGMPVLGETGLQHIMVVFTFVFLIFYIVASYVAFQAYKEFKALQYEMGGQGGFIGGNYRRSGQAVGGANYSSNQPRDEEDYRANTNYGGVGGGDTEAYSTQPVSSNNLVQPSQQRQQPQSEEQIIFNENSYNFKNAGTNSGNRGQFFTGKGVRIG